MKIRPRLVLALIALAISGAGATARVTTAGGSSGCNAALVHYTPYPGGAPGLGELPWVRATSRGLGLVALLWYWPTEWRSREIDRALIYPGGKTRGEINTKIMWTFLSDKAKRDFSGGNLIVRGQRLDGPGKTWQQFVGIGYEGQNGAPSYASIITLPSEGCWRLQLGAGGLRASVIFQAVTTA
jgi:hypothetical protein